MLKTGISLYNATKCQQEMEFTTQTAVFYNRWFDSITFYCIDSRLRLVLEGAK